MGRYQLTEDAAGDLEDIFVYGYETFGLDQAIEYQFEFDHVFQLLAENPLLGPRADETPEPMRRHLHGRHIIYYEPLNDGALIIGIIHMASIRRPASPAAG